MIKFVERRVYKTQEFADQNGTLYRTSTGQPNTWEELMGMSWEAAMFDEELVAAYERFQREAK